MMIDIPHPLQDTLENLRFEIDTSGIKEPLDKGEISDLI
jgi:hypothetical protein